MGKAKKPTGADASDPASQQQQKLEPCPGCGAAEGEQHADDCPVMLAAKAKAEAEAEDKTAAGARAKAGGTGNDVKAFHDEFVSNLPPGAENGAYHATSHDGFAGRIFKGLHGVVFWGEWAFKFVEGRFEEALHETRLALVGEADAPVDGDKTDVA